jgi:hypothetical protein
MKLTLSKEEVEQVLLEHIQVQGVPLRNMMKYRFLWSTDTVEITYEQLEPEQQEPPIMFGTRVRRGD